MQELQVVDNPEDTMLRFPSPVLQKPVHTIRKIVLQIITKYYPFLTSTKQCSPDSPAVRFCQNTLFSLCHFRSLPSPLVK